LHFTSFAFNNTLKEAGIRISMDGWPLEEQSLHRAAVAIVEDECVFLNAFETGSDSRAGIGRRIGYYHTDRPHSALAGRTPDETYAIDMTPKKLTA